MAAHCAQLAQIDCGAMSTQIVKAPLATLVLKAMHVSAVTTILPMEANQIQIVADSVAPNA